MKKNSTIDLLKRLKCENKITTQQLKTFKGQCLSGDEKGCRRGLKRMNLIKE